MKLKTDDVWMFAGAAAVTAVALVTVFRLGPRAIGQGVRDAARELGQATGVDPTGTPYEGWGALGVVGNVTNRALGGVPERLGSWIGQRLADWRGL